MHLETSALAENGMQQIDVATISILYIAWPGRVCRTESEHTRRRDTSSHGERFFRLLCHDFSTELTFWTNYLARASCVHGHLRRRSVDRVLSFARYALVTTVEHHFPRVQFLNCCRFALLGIG